MTNAFVYVGLGSEGGAEGHGLYRRSLEGGDWELKADGLPANPEIRVIAVAPNDSAVVYTGPAGRAVSQRQSGGFVGEDVPAGGSRSRLVGGLPS